jgi:hypothetical protein
MRRRSRARSTPKALDFEFATDSRHEVEKQDNQIAHRHES